MRKLKLSASSINAYKACPFRFRNAYVLGIRPVEDTEAQRIGTNWHEILEVASLEPGGKCPECEMNVAAGDRFDPNDCIICAGTGKVPNDVMDAVVRVLNQRYADVPVQLKEKMDIERIKLLYALIGYRWYYGTDFEPAIVREQYFSLPLLNPETGHPVPNVFITGKIDKLVSILEGTGVKEHKTTGSSIDSDSTYWAHLNMDSQTGIYIYAARRLQLAGELEQYEIKTTDNLISKISYDVHHKPQISPKKLTQGDSKKFVETGEYCGQKFDLTKSDETNPLNKYYVNGIEVEYEPGKKEGTFAIRETPEMFGARLLLDITERPTFYFVCKELVRTDAEMKAFEYELYDIAKDMMSKIRADRWWHNENQCEATFKCSYIDSCYNHIPLDPENPPAGMRCIFRKKEEVTE
ncbi:MAG: PD-(D/E)XK nuclease family protein [Nitrosomonadaceae bacterium]